MQKSADNLFPSVRIVLIETSHPGNIGAAARAMKNMGLTRLVLVNPKDFPDDTAFRPMTQHFGELLAPSTWLAQPLWWIPSMRRLKVAS